MTRDIFWPLCVVAVMVLGVFAIKAAESANESSAPSASAAAPTPSTKPPPIPVPVEAEESLARCKPRGVQDFLIRHKYLSKRAGIRKAVNWRLDHYMPQIQTTTFFGLPILLHEKAHGPLRCAEKWIKKTCPDDYRPHNLSGWRARHTYKGDEISNHVLGIAIDVDPELNSCCGCQGHWANSELCFMFHGAQLDEPRLLEDGPGDYSLPHCWIDAFERFGFYWLGCDPMLRDTMHFEYLALPGAFKGCP